MLPNDNRISSVYVFWSNLFSNRVVKVRRIIFLRIGIFLYLCKNDNTVFEIQGLSVFHFHLVQLLWYQTRLWSWVDTLPSIRICTCDWEADNPLLTKLADSRMHLSLLLIIMAIWSQKASDETAFQYPSDKINIVFTCARPFPSNT